MQKERKYPYPKERKTYLLFLIALMLLIQLKAVSAKTISISGYEFDLLETGTLLDKPIGIPYKRQCLTECHLPIKIDSKLILEEGDIEYYFKDKTGLVNDCNKIEIKYLVNTSFFDQEQKKSCQLVLNETECQYEPIQVERWGFKWVAQPLNPTFAIDIICYRDAIIGLGTIDIVPIIKGIELSAFDWWNTNWYNRYNFTIADTTGYQRMNELIRINFTNLTDKQGDNDDIRLINLSNNAEIPYATVRSGNDYAEIVFFVNISASGNVSYEIYWNNSVAVNPSYPVSDWTWDLFDGVSLDANKWDETVASDASHTYGQDGSTRWFKDTDASGTPSYLVTYADRNWQTTDTWTYEFSYNLSLGATAYTAWSFTNFGYRTSGVTKHHGCGHTYNDYNTYCAVGDASDNINQNNPNSINLSVPANSGNPNYPNRMRFMHLSDGATFVAFSDDNGGFWTNWTNITAIAGTTPYELQFGKSATSGGYGDASSYDFHLDYVLPLMITDANFTIGFGVSEYNPPPVSVGTNYSEIRSYYCNNNNNSVYNVTWSNDSSNWNYEYYTEICFNGCDEDNLIISILDNTPSLCNPTHWLQSVMVISVVIIVIWFIKRFVK